MDKIKMLFSLIKKEYFELVRDQRSLLATFSYALLGPLLLFMLTKQIIGDATEKTQVTIAIQKTQQNLQEIEELHEFFISRNIKTLSYEGDMPKRFPHDAFTANGTTNNEFDVLLKVSQPSNAVNSKNFVIEVYGDNSNNKQSNKLDKVDTLVSQFIHDKKQNKLFNQGVITLDRTWSKRSHVVNSQSAQGSRLMESLLIFLLLAPFFITLSYINDATAGERERGSLMPLLTQPMNRMNLVVSKWSVGSLLGIFGTFVTMYLGFELIGNLPLYEVGIELNATSQNMMLTLLLIAPLALLVASLQMWIALAAKNFKEGQSYLTLFGLVPMVVVFMSAKFDQISWSSLIPLVGHQQMLKSLYGAQEFDWTQFLGLSSICLVISMFVLFSVKQLFNSEKILQGR